MRLLIAAMAVLLLVTPTVKAEIYQWVDENGKVRFSDKPPAGHEANSESSLHPEAMPGSSNSGRLLKAGSNSRPATLEVIRYQIAEEDLDKEIGKRYSSYSGAGMTGCSSNERLLDTNFALQVLRKGKNGYHRSFHSLLKEQGYKVADATESVFANQRAKAAEISIAALVTSAYFEHCDLSGINRESFNKTRLTIEWQLFDNLKREVIYKISTSGNDNSWGNRSPEGELVSFEKAMLAAAKELLGYQDFVEALDDVTAPPSVPVHPGDRSVAYTYGSRAGNFLDNTAAIERGTVTIRTPSGHGSGFVISSTGHVLTNEHVVAGSDRVIVLTAIGETVGAVVHRNAERDVALIQIEELFSRDPLHVSPHELRVGEQIYVVGTPLSEELNFSVTRGIISGKREVRGLPLYQTDAAVNKGNSGGPVLDEFGNVVAISVSGIFSKSGGSLNTNFLIPIEDALKKIRIYLSPD